eukprot:8029191-Pyramimonas_sp.AAC.1
MRAALAANNSAAVALLVARGADPNAPPPEGPVPEQPMAEDPPRGGRALNIPITAAPLEAANLMNR